MPLLTSLSKLGSGARSTIETTAGICEIGAVATAVWAVCFPEKAADHWARFELHVEAARADLARIADSTDAIASNTADTATSSRTVANWVEAMASVERGLEVYTFATMESDEAGSAQAESATFYINVGNLSSTPLVNFAYTLLDETKAPIGSRRTARLVQNANLEAELTAPMSAERLLADPSTAWLCAAGEIGQTGAQAYFTLELEGHPSADKTVSHTIVSIEASATPSETCAGAAHF